LGGGQRLAVDRAHDAVDARSDPTVEITFAEARRDHLRDDALGDRVRYRSLQTAPDLDTQLAIVLRDEKQYPIVHADAAELPLIEDADRELLDRLGLGGGNDQHRHLTALALLEVRELRLESAR
jgi:hypothetical protein